jgi:hypothetical protein
MAEGRERHGTEKTLGNRNIQNEQELKALLKALMNRPEREISV